MKRGNKTTRSTLGNFCWIKTFSGKNKLRLEQNAKKLFLEEKPLTLGIEQDNMYITS